MACTAERQPLMSHKPSSTDEMLSKAGIALPCFFLLGVLAFWMLKLLVDEEWSEELCGLSPPNIVWPEGWWSDCFYIMAIFAPSCSMLLFFCLMMLVMGKQPTPQPEASTRRGFSWALVALNVVVLLTPDVSAVEKIIQGKGLALLVPMMVLRMSAWLASLLILLVNIKRGDQIVPHFLGVFWLSYGAGMVAITPDVVSRWGSGFMLEDVSFILCLVSQLALCTCFLWQYMKERRALQGQDPIWRTATSAITSPYQGNGLLAAVMIISSIASVRIP